MFNNYSHYDITAVNGGMSSARALSGGMVYVGQF